MFVELEAEIQGNFYVENEMEVKHHPLIFNIRFDDIEKKYFISIRKKVCNYSSQLPKIRIRDGKNTEIELPSEDFLEEEKRILQHIESFGAIDNGIEKIHWEKCKINWIPETQAEEKELQLKCYERALSYDFPPKKLSKEWLSTTIIHRTQLSHLYLPFSFFREGMNLYHNQRYQNSFLNFYLMLEGIFGNGKDYRNKVMKREFLKSDILDYSINQTISNLRTTKDIHYSWLENACKHYNKNIDKNGIIHFIVELRGNLSHFSLNDSRKQRNPFKEKDYHSLAYISMSICLYASIKLRLAPFLSNSKV